MPKFDLDQLFQYLIVIAIVVGPILAAVVKKLIAYFSPKPPELPKPPVQSRMKVPAAQVRTARPVPPIEPPLVPTVPTARAAQPEQPAVGQPRPIARRVAFGGATATTAARQARSPADVPMTLEAMVEDHLGHLTSNIESETERVDRGVKRRLKHVETHVATLQSKWDRPAEQKTVTDAPTASTSVRRLTRQDLRRAILLREILGPPVALRAPDEPW
ncbi:MAG: hypothetical protein IID33_05210 [Planctomycetes bacterium]|nr:hypothetical protein [Planctomycetota bacterium]